MFSSVFEGMNTHPILKYMSHFYLTDIYTSDLPGMSFFQIGVQFSLSQIDAL